MPHKSKFSTVTDFLTVPIFMPTAPQKPLALALRDGDCLLAYSRIARNTTIEHPAASTSERRRSYCVASAWFDQQSKRSGVYPHLIFWAGQRNVAAGKGSTPERLF
jgi:hypothetical protein